MAVRKNKTAANRFITSIFIRIYIFKIGDTAESAEL